MRVFLPEQSCIGRNDDKNNIIKYASDKITIYCDAIKSIRWTFNKKCLSFDKERERERH